MRDHRKEEKARREAEKQELQQLRKENKWLKNALIRLQKVKKDG